MFIRNCWYVAAWTHEIEGDALFPRTICGTGIVFWRDEQGNIQALEDRCCHRGAPLSCGRKEGNHVRCMYHGFKYDTTGACVEVPGQSVIPSKARVRKFTVVERHRWIWVWMGDPAQADEALIPDTHWLDDPDWACTPPGYLHIEANYQLLNDNLLDFSHLAYVHSKTLGGSEEYAQLRSKIERIDRGLRLTRWFMDHPAPPFVQKILKGQGNVDRWNNYDFLLPGVLIMDSGFAPAGSNADRGNRQGAIEFRHCQVVTPETEHSTHYFFSQPRNFAKDDQDVNQALYESILRAFEEDRAIITAQAKILKKDPSFEVVPCGLDSALMQFRGRIDQAISEELAEEASRKYVASPGALSGL